MDIFWIVYAVCCLIMLMFFIIHSDDIRDFTVGELLIAAFLSFTPGVNSVMAFVSIVHSLDESGILEKKPFAKKVPDDSTGM
jgi:hypothetical protein